MDPLRHPDLIDISRRLRLQLSQVLEAEQEAAAIIRDRLLDAEDRAEVVRATCTDGVGRTGEVGAVGIDHVVLNMDGTSAYVAISHIIAVEVAK